MRTERCILIEIQLQFHRDQSPYLSSNIQSTVRYTQFSGSSNHNPVQELDCGQLCSIGMLQTGKTELLLVAAAPYPIHAASPQWCSLLGVSEHDLKGCGFKVFDTDFRPHTQVLIFSLPAQLGRRYTKPEILCVIILYT